MSGPCAVAHPRPLQPVEGGLLNVRFGDGGHEPASREAAAVGVSRSNSQRAGLSMMYWRVRFNDSSLRTICSW